MAERHTTTPLERAEAALGVASRKHERTKAKLAAAEALVESAKLAMGQADAELAYAGQHPALPEEVRAQYIPRPEVAVTTGEVPDE